MKTVGCNVIKMVFSLKAGVLYSIQVKKTGFCCILDKNQGLVFLGISVATTSQTESEVTPYIYIHTYMYIYST